jgi:hypothetical protein
MSGIRYTEPTRAELAAIARSALTQDQIVDVAERGRNHAEGIAPVETGAFRSSFRVERGDGEALIVNDDPGAAAIEFGSDDTPAHHVMTQTADWLESEAR